ncbi:MAG: MATE family efflux transporter [Lachnospiraceae bacterium]|nr:MATE family efflux transporter [Lachnospiraceae bacterium]
MEKKEFYNKLRYIALPITIQSIFQAILSLIDEVMIGNLGSASIAGVGLSIKYTSLFSVVMATIVTVAGILIAQYKGNDDAEGMSTSFYGNLYLILGIAALFIVASMIFAEPIMGIYSDDPATVHQAAIYLRMVAWGFIPQALVLMLSTLLRNLGGATYIMYASAISVATNTLGNYLFINGIGFFPRMDIAGAALATCLSRVIELALVYAIYCKIRVESGFSLGFVTSFSKGFLKKIGTILAPILLSEFLWSLGDNVYAYIYGHLGTFACAAMTVTYPIQGLAIGALSGVAAASGIIVGESLGAQNEEKAYQDARSIMKLTITVGIALSILIAVVSHGYVLLFNVDAQVQQQAIWILYAYCLVFCGKVTNMVLGGGILRSGGQTQYTMLIVIGATWLVGVPFGLISAYLFHWPIHLVYFALSLEEYVRVACKVRLFRSGKWMSNLTEEDNQKACA